MEAWIAAVAGLAAAVLGVGAAAIKFYRDFRTAKTEAAQKDNELEHLKRKGQAEFEKDRDFNVIKLSDEFVARQTREIDRLSKLVVDLQARVQYLFEETNTCAGEMAELYGFTQVLHGIAIRHTRQLQRLGIVDVEDIPDLPQRRKRRPQDEAGFHARSAMQAVQITAEVNLQEKQEGTEAGSGTSGSGI